MLIQNNRLPVRVPPFQSESLRGYLMRSAEVNDLTGIDRLLINAVGGTRIPVTPKIAVILADYCRLDVHEFFQLFGVEYRVATSRQWQIAGEWITKDYFVRPNQPSLCPHCLLEEPYLRGLWELSFYIACPKHNCLLVTTCPSCQRKLSAHRSRLGRCNCGFHFTILNADPAPPEAILVADLIETRITGESKVTYASHCIVSTVVIERLARLSLDSLFKTIWFLGHCFTEKGALETGHARIRPDNSIILAIIQKAINVLNHWPASFIDGLKQRTEFFDPDVGKSPERYLMPLRHYLEKELVEQEATFIHAAYERFLRDAWKKRSPTTYHLGRIKQMELF